ncbi:MAG: bis(5'-nucleosyl)-tetraphosphatase (symmetrical) YqeK [Anaerolineales bacterium]|nr:bis(5'-nucleosyl)-tetraphosphatase (symmetrical) YqeK [Anaerolineales bacterium]
MPPDLDYMTYLKQILTPKRLEHSLGVRQVMGELAEVYELDKEKALTIGLLHDAGKDLSPTRRKQILAEASIEIRHEVERNYLFYLHGPVGAYLVRKELGITDELILGAIETHTYAGNSQNFNHPLCWCLRFADILEPNRDFRAVKRLHKGKERLRNLVYAGQMAEGAYLHSGWLLRWFEEDGLPIHPNIRRVHQDLAAQLNLDDTFLEQD